MTTDDKDVSRRYRELPREEPSRQVDDAILAASRRAVHTRPAPLVVPSGRQRWYFPLAAAAIIVLAVAVTVHMEREQPAEEIVSSNTVTAPAGAREADSAGQALQAPPPTPSAPARAPSSSPRGVEMRDQTFTEERARREAPPPTEAPPRLDMQPPRELQKSPEVAGTPPAASQDALRAQQATGAVLSRVEPPAQPAAAPQAKAASPRVQASIAEKPASAAPKLGASAMQSPDQWLLGIADLLRQGYRDEADRQIAEFRKRYPDYRIPESITEKFETR